MADRNVGDRSPAIGLRVGVLTGCAALDGQWQSLLGAVDCRTGLLPDDKVLHLRSGAHASAVAMVGDGLNDAPALAAADVGIALGTGKDLTREAAQVNILSADLSAVAWLFEWSREVRRTVLQNLGWALAYNTLALAAAVAGWLNPIIAALAMIASSVFIVTNSQRLGRRADMQAPPHSRPSPTALAHAPSMSS